MSALAQTEDIGFVQKCMYKHKQEQTQTDRRLRLKKGPKQDSTLISLGSGHCAMHTTANKEINLEYSPIALYNDVIQRIKID